MSLIRPTLRACLLGIIDTLLRSTLCYVRLKKFSRDLKIYITTTITNIFKKVLPKAKKSNTS
jgi:hypothetical protein